MDKTLTVVNPNVRLARGLPVIKMETEMRYYGVEDPYENDYTEYKGEYLCLWEVTPDEVVGHWDWEDLVDDPDWFGNVVMPAFVEHNYRFLGELSGQGDRDLANFLDALTVECASLISDEEDVEDSVDEDEDEDALTPTGVWDIENDLWWATYPGVEESNVLFHPVTSSRIVW